MIFGQGFLPLALEKSIPNCRAAVLVWSVPGILFPRYPPYLVSVPLSATWGGARWETNNFSKGEMEKRTSKKNLDGRNTSGHDNKKLRKRSMEKQRGMATAVK